MLRTLVSLCVASLAAPVLAQSAADKPLPGQPPVSQPATPATPPDPAKATTTTPFERFDALGLKGWEIPFPRSADTIIADKGGVRDWLADRGIGFLGIVGGTLQYDLLQNDHGYHGPQIYNGQKLTRTATNFTIYATYDLGEIGLEGGQLSTTLARITNSFNRVDGPNVWRVARVDYFQSLFHDRVQLKVGITDNAYEFLGTNIGGSIVAGNLGPLATIPYQVGLSYGGFGAPSVNVRFDLGGNFYDKFAVQRSLAPGGANAEYRVNRSGFVFAPRGTGVLGINEFGYKRAATAGTRSLWLRGGGIVNSTDYPSYRGGTASDNWALFAAGDAQVVQIDETKPARGLYLGGTVNYAPPGQNLYSKYVEGRVYGLGLLRSRPFDLASLVATYTGFSRSALRSLTQPGNGNYKQSVAVVASYSYRLMPGLYLQPGLGVAVHPTYTPRFGTALNGYLSITSLF